jgi:hypothetical protein
MPHPTTQSKDTNMNARNFNKDDSATLAVLAGFFITIAVALFSASPATAQPTNAASKTNVVAGTTAKVESITVVATRLK